MEFIYIFIILIVAIVSIIWIQKNAKAQNIELQNEITTLKVEKESMLSQQISYIKQIADLEASVQYKEELLKNKTDELLQVREQMNKDFQILANQILEEKTSKFTDTNKINIEAILKPLNEKLTEFKAKVEETYDKESKQRFSLEERIRELVSLNTQISEDANNLTQALKGNAKIQGNWGEMLLESILENRG